MAQTPIKHRLAAILAADVAGFARLMAIDERATLAALDAARAIFAARIAAAAGRVVDMAGDSVLAVFETARGAVEAGLAVQNALSVAQPEVCGAPLQFRIGVHLGDVIEKRDGTVYGDGVNIAARLQAIAEPGGIVASEAVRGVVDGHVSARFDDQGRQSLKHISAPIHAYAIRSVAAEAAQAGGGEPDVRRTAGPRSLPVPPAADAAGAAPVSKARDRERPATLFVGRKPELAQLTAALRTARKGFGRVMLIAGSGGIGKTCLAQQLAKEAEREGMTLLWGRCLEEAGAPPYWPWRQLIRSHLRGAAAADAAPLLGNGLQDIAAIVPEVAERFGVPVDAGAAAPVSTQERLRLFDAVAGYLRRAAQHTPLLLIFEDLHWADATSLRLFAYLAGEIEDCAAMVVGTYRDTELSRQHPLFETLADLTRCAASERIELTGLSVEETSEFAAAASRVSPSAALIRALHERTEGHPLFLEETLRCLIAARAQQGIDASGDEARWLLTKIPTGVREVIGKRLNRLSLPALRHLSIAACIGRRFDLQLLAELETGKSEDELLAALDEALAEHLIEPAPDSHDFRFGHALIRETLYDEIVGVRRARLHLRIGEALERRHGSDDAGVWPQLAYHFGEAGPGAAAKALAHAKLAAAHAARVLAFEEAARWWGVALQTLERHFGNDPAQRCELLLARADAQRWGATAEAAGETYLQAAELARRNKLSEAFARAALGFSNSSTQAGRSGEPALALLLEATALRRGDDALRVELIARLCVACVYCDRPAEAMQAHRRAVALARELGDARSLYLALASIATAIYWPALLPERLAAAAEAWAIAERLDQRDRISQLLPWYLCDLMQAGDAATLARLRAQGLRLCEQWRAPYWLSICRHVEVLVAINEGRFDDAERWALLALREGRGVADDRAVGAYGMQMFCLRREQGRLHEALPVLQRFVRDTPDAQRWKPGLALIYAELGMRDACAAEYASLEWPRLSGPPSDASGMTMAMFAAEVCIHLGDTERAPQLYAMLEGRAGMNLLGDSSGPCLGSADRLLGGLAAVIRQWDAAERHFEAALAMDGATGWQVWLAHSRYRYAQMLQRRAGPGDPQRARSLLADALAQSTALHMQALTPRIEALIEAIDVPAPAYPCGLTEREVEVLRLIAIGRNNREIGQVLEISPNTVANHVRSILEKTYTANRTEAAAFANRERLIGP